MAVRGGSSRCSWLRCVRILLALLLSVAAIHVAVAGETPQLGAYCGSIDACRGGVANDACCRAINVAIVQATCSCACRQLSVYDHVNLAAACSRRAGCPMCRDCKCSKYADDVSNM